MDYISIRTRLKEKGLKVTPQRVAVYKALIDLKNHPSADAVAEYVRNHHPGIATGTVYKVLDIFTVRQISFVTFCYNWRLTLKNYFEKNIK